MNYWRTMVLLISLQGSAVALSADSEADSDDQEALMIYLDPLVISATRAAPQPITDTTLRTQVLKGADIERLQARDLAEALRLVPGLQLREIHGKTGQEVQLQGFSGDRVLVLVNGKPVAATTGSTVDVTQLSALDVDHIEVIAGAASSLYGSAAMGGVINIITRPQSARLRLLAEAGSYGDDELRAGLPQRHYLLSSAHTQGPWALSLGLDRRQTSEIDLNKDTWASNGFGGSKQNSTATLGYRGEQSDWQLDLQHYQEDLSQRLEEDVSKDEDLVRRRLGLDLHHQQDRGRWTFSALAEQQQDSTLQANRDSSVSAGQLQRQAHYRQQKLGLEWASSADLLDDAAALSLQLVAGSEWFREELNQNKRQIRLGYLDDYQAGSNEQVSQLDDGLLDIRAAEVEGHRHSQELFNQTTLGWQQGSRHFDVGLGWRWQHDSDFGGHLAPTLSARQSWLENHDWQLQTRQSWGSGYRVANLKERYYEFDHSLYGYRVSGNPELSPEQSRSTQLSVSLSRPQHWQLELSAFHNRINDLIETVDSGEVDTSNGSYVVLYHYDNIERALTRGLELSGQWQLSPSLQQRAAFNYLDARDIGNDQPLINRARQHARLIWLWDASRRININLVGEYQGGLIASVDSDSGLQQHSPDYWRWDLSASLNTHWSGARQRWFTGIRNLTDQVRNSADSYDRRPTEGRYVYAGFDWRI